MAEQEKKDQQKKGSKPSAEEIAAKKAATAKQKSAQVEEAADEAPSEPAPPARLIGLTHTTHSTGHFAVSRSSPPKPGSRNQRKRSSPTPKPTSVPPASQRTSGCKRASSAPSQRSPGAHPNRCCTAATSYN